MHRADFCSVWILHFKTKIQILHFKPKVQKLKDNFCDQSRHTTFFISMHDATFYSRSMFDFVIIGCKNVSFKSQFMSKSQIKSCIQTIFDFENNLE